MSEINLLIASNNRGKLREVVEILHGLPFRIIRPADIGLELDVPETGATYAENARIKARAFSERSGMIALADDSGLEVIGLGGWPGHQSARFAGPDATDRDRCDRLLRRLAGRPETDRRARFVCHVTLCDPRQILVEGQGVLEGRIATEPAGVEGFGFDPIFIPDGFDCTVAELPAEIKNTMSHRARAIESIRPFLAQLVRS